MAEQEVAAPEAFRSGERQLTAREVAELLGISLNSVKRIPTSDLPYWTFGTRKDRRYDRVDVAAYMAARREA